MFDQLDLVTYEEVVKLPAFKRKTLVLLGEPPPAGPALLTFDPLTPGCHSDPLLTQVKTAVSA